MNRGSGQNPICRHSHVRGNDERAMFAKLFRQILICLFIAVGANSSASGQETDRATLIERAKKEGEVVWYTSAGLQDSKPMADAFQKDYPFIQVSILRAGSGVLINKILNEARAQKGLFDVLNTNDESVLPLKRRGLIARYVSSEATAYEDDLKDKEGYWHAAYVVPWFLGYNTRMVKKDEVPKNYEELLTPKWKGRKIVLGSDNGSLILSGLIRVWGREKAVRYFQQLAKQEPALQAGAPSSRIQLLAAGEFPLTLASGNTLQTFASRGAPVDWVPLEPVFVQLNTIMLAAQSRHPNATKLFIDFVLSKKGQEMIRSFHRVPARTGVDAEPPRIFKGFKRVVQDIEAAASGEETTKLYNEIFNIR
jgi:iron(III) transport system substrate-binding protein